MNFEIRDIFIEIVSHGLDAYDFINLYSCSTESVACLESEIFEPWREIRILRAAFLSRKKHHLFITGSAGSGKSFALQRIYDQNTARGIKTHIVSPTGISACNFSEASTIHSFFSISPSVTSLGELNLDTSHFTSKLVKKIRNTKVLLIDEVSMVSELLFEIMNAICQHIRRNEKPMGDITIVTSGDFFQLPPIEGRYCFHSAIWKELGPEIIQLPLSVRHKCDMPYYLLLQRLRIGRITRKDVRMLQERGNAVVPAKGTIPEQEQMVGKAVSLYTINSTADAQNIRDFAALPGEILFSQTAIDSVTIRKKVGEKFVYTPTTQMTVAEAVKTVKNKLYKYPDQLHFKIGAQYLITKNIDIGIGAVNGATCVYGLSDDGSSIVFRLSSGIEIDLVPQMVRLKVKGDIYLERIQYPLRLGYAITIHNSQGMTLDAATIDLKNTFAAHQTYVALSRVKTLKGLFLRNFSVDGILVSQDVYNFYERLNK